MNAIKQFFTTLMYIFLGLTIIAVLYFSYLFATSVSSSDINTFAEEQKVNFTEFLEEAKVHLANAKVLAGELSEQFMIASIYYIGQLEYTTANLHTDIIKNHKIVQLMKNPPPVIVEDISNRNIFTSDVFLSTQGDNKLVYYNQTLEPWRNIEYGPNNTIGKYGCGPTAMSMVLSTFLQQDITPAMAAQWAYAHNYFAHNSGSYHSLIPDMANAFDLVSTSLKMPTLDDLLNELDKGNLIVVLLGKGTFASAGHFVVLRDRTEDGQIYMADSQSIKISQQAWDGNLILNEAKYYANSGGPFWSISLPQNSNMELEELPEEDMFIEGIVEVLESETETDEVSNSIYVNPTENEEIDTTTTNNSIDNNLNIEVNEETINTSNNTSNSISEDIENTNLNNLNDIANLVRSQEISNEPIY